MRLCDSATVAGVFTKNRFCAAPVRICQSNLENVRKTGKKIRALMVNTGNANAGTGEAGYQDALRTSAALAKLMGCDTEQVLPFSTGVILEPLPVDRILAGLPAAVKDLKADNWFNAAEAIMTTDTIPKAASRVVEIGGKTVTLTGICKGAGMIAPKMAVPHATMLCYITTDCVISNRQLSAMLGEVVDDSFNKVTVDGDMSTNDTVIVMANGASGAEIREGSIDELHFKTALTMVAQHLARSIAMDGEGATKFVSVEVSGAANNSEAELCARTVANSLLCKTAWFGCDPNWGRVLAAAGRSGANFSAENVSLDYDEMPVVRNGMDAGVPEAELARVLKRGEFTIKLNLGEGHGSFTVWTSDVSYEYVKINADYHT